MERICFYLFTDKEGIASNYIEYFLDDLFRNSKKIVIISLYSLKPESRKLFEKYSDIILVQNDKFPIDTKIFKDYVLKYDEVTFISDSIMGPLFPMRNMFLKMEEKELDIWGVFLNKKNGKVYIPFDFISIRKKLLLSFEFRRYIRHRANIINLSEQNACEFFEYFADRGFILDTFIKDNSLLEFSETPQMMYPCTFVKQFNCPIFFKNIFTDRYEELINVSIGNSARDLYHLIETEYSEYLKYFWSYLLRVSHQSDLQKRLHLNYVLSTTYFDEITVKEIIDKYKIALVIHVFRPEVLKQYLSYLTSMPISTHCYITTDTEEKRQILLKEYSELPYAKIEIRVIQNRGRDVGSKLVGVRDIVQNYDLICCVHDKKTPHLKPMTIGEGFGYKCYQNVLFNKYYVYNILKLFWDHPYMGIAVPPEPNHGTMFTTLGCEWVGNYEITEALAQRLNLSVPISPEKEPVAPFGSFFWFRPKALKLLFDINWKYEDFPEEPIGDDATILHAVERIYPFVAQQEGYYSAVIMADEYSRIEFSNLRYYLREYNKCLIEHGVINSHSEMIKELNRRLD